MEGYGYSIWLVPYTNQDILLSLIKQYNDQIHIPHVTIKTNIHYITDAVEYYNDVMKLVGDDISINLLTSPVNFESTYEIDPIKYSWGFMVDIKHKKIRDYIKHPPHLTIGYNNEKDKHQSLELAETEFKCRVGIYSTESLHPSHWFKL